MPHATKARLNPQEVCELLDVTMFALRRWRNPARLAGGLSSPLYLPGTPDPSDPRLIWYSTDDVVAFCRRNERYRDRWLAAFAPTSALSSLHQQGLHP